jgi:DNA-binding LytR/AlgR family response regulator
MDKIKTLIVEDNLLISESVASILQKNGVEVVAQCDSGEDAIKVVKEKTPDLILMDIHLAGALDGISTAKLIKQESPIPIIYLTDFTDKATVDRAKKTFPANYLSKPFNEDELLRAIEIAFFNSTKEKSQEKKSQSNETYFFRTDTKFVKFKKNEILLLEAERSYCKIVTTKETILLSTSMNHVHEQLDPSLFVKVHRSFVVNLNKVAEFEGNIIRIEGGHEIQMGKEFRQDFIAQLKIIK